MLFPDRAPGTFAGACVRTRPLTAQRQTAAMTDAAVATEIEQPLDAHRHLSAQITFDGHLADFAANRVEVRLRKILDLGAWLDAGRFANAQRRGPPDAVDIGQRDERV